MNHKEEAERLIKLFFEPASQMNFTESHGWELDRKQSEINAKACAAICVKEIMKVVPYVDDRIREDVRQLRSSLTSFASYWQKVLEQINKP